MAGKMKKQAQYTTFAKLMGELGFVPEYKFHETRKWRFDFAHPQLRIAIEIEGGIWIRGRHTRAIGYRNDIEKYNSATIAGWRILRFLPEELPTTKPLIMINQLIQDYGKRK